MLHWFRKSTVETKDATLANPDPELLALFGIGNIEVITRQQAMDVAPVQAAVRAISEAAASLDVSVVRIGDDGTEAEDPKHPVADLLRDHVNDWTSSFDFVRDLVAQALMQDAGGLAWVNRVGEGRPSEIIHYRTGMIQVKVADTGELSYTLEGKSLDPADVIHLRAPFNRCPLSMAMRPATVAYHLENHALNLFRKGARPGGVIQFPKMLGDEGLKKMKAGWQAAFGGSDNAGGTAVLWDGATFNPMTLNSTDAQFLENRKFQIDEIARAFRVPAGMLFQLDRVTWSNGEQQAKEFLSYSLEPWLRGLEAALRRALFSAEERPLYKIVFDRDDLTRASLTERATAINSLIASETINPNTGREWLGLPPYDGGDKYGNRNIGSAKPEPTAAPAASLRAVA
jgi:HK97 family phage portal protein